MANFFDWLNKAFEGDSPENPTDITVSAHGTPATSLFAVSALMLSELAKTQEQSLTRRHELAVAKRMQAIGFSNTYEVAKTEQFNKNVELLTFMCQMWRDLGRNTILIGHKQFRTILHKYDLMCVPFSHYKGDIPEKNLSDIESALTKVQCYKGYSYYPYHNIASRSARELIENIRYPWGYNGRPDALGEKDSLLFNYNTKFESPLYIAAPKAFVQKPHVGYNSSNSYQMFLSDREINNRQRANAILERIKDYANVKFASVPYRLPRDYDPFVCSNCRYGVIIHSMWGAEAEDATIKRYEQLRDAIIGKGGVV